MKNFISGIALILTVVSMMSCGAPCVEGSGDVIKEKRPIQAFTEVELRIEGDMELLYSPATKIYSIVVEAQENLLPFINTRVEGNKLIVEAEQCVNTTEPINFIVPVVKLSSVVNQGSGRIFSASNFPYDEMELVNEGSGMLDLALKGEEIEIYNYGSGTIAASGVAIDLTCLNRGSGEVMLTELMTNDANVKNMGSGNVTFRAEESITAKNEGSGNIGYKGNPRSVDSDNQGSGSIYSME